MCFPCVSPLVAAILAMLGLPYPILPEGGLRYVLGVLAVYRLVMMIGLDDGPFNLLLRFRTWAGVYDLGPNGQPRRGGGRFLACPYCVGVLVAAVVTFLVLWPTFGGDILLIAYGLAGAQAVLQERLHGAREGW